MIGYLHVLREDLTNFVPSRSMKIVHKQVTVDWAKRTRECEENLPTRKFWDFAWGIGVAEQSLINFGVGWSKEHKAWTFPMWESTNTICGIRLRSTSGGKKWCIKGSKQGLFIPRDFRMSIDGRLFLTEGPTDAAALLDMGFNAVGRPNCDAGISLLEDLVRCHRPSEVFVVSDADQAGRRGAAAIASALAPLSTVRVIEPPDGVKDIREWYIKGATANDVENLVRQAQPVGVSINKVA